MSKRIARVAFSADLAEFIEDRFGELPSGFRYKSSMGCWRGDCAYATYLTVELDGDGEPAPIPGYCRWKFGRTENGNGQYVEVWHTDNEDVPDDLQDLLVIVWDGHFAVLADGIKHPSLYAWPKPVD